MLASAALGTRSIVDPGRGAIAAATTADWFAQQPIDLLGNPVRLAEFAAEGLRFATNGLPIGRRNSWRCTTLL